MFSPAKPLWWVFKNIKMFVGLSWLSLLFTWDDTAKMTYSIYSALGDTQVPACWLSKPSFIMLWCCMVIRYSASQSSSSNHLSQNSKYHTKIPFSLKQWTAIQGFVYRFQATSVIHFPMKEKLNKMALMRQNPIWFSIPFCSITELKWEKLF